MSKPTLLLVSLLVLLLSGCAQNSQETVEDALQLKVKLTMKAQGEVAVSAGLHNASMFEYPGTDQYNGFLTILDEAGRLRALGELNKCSLLAAGETFYPLTYNLSAEPGTYRLKFSALGKPPVEMQFEVVDRDGRLYLTAPGEYIDPITEYTIAS